MRGLLKGLAIAALLVTVIGAGIVLYGLNAMEPVVLQVSVTATPATQAQETLGAVLSQVDNGTFGGTQFPPADGVSAETCTFVTYTVRLQNRGFFPAEDLKTLRHIGSYLQGHSNMNSVPGVDMSTGSLGQGVSVAAGMAKAAKLLDNGVNVYTMLGDGEIDEGEVWEAFMFAAHYHLDNLCVMIDLNGLQIDGATKDVMNSEPVDAKMEAFGFDVVTIDGHDFAQIERAFGVFHQNAGSGKPTCILMRTIKGKGVSYMENNADWHGKAPNDKEYEAAMQELRAQLEELEAAQ